MPRQAVGLLVCSLVILACEGEVLRTSSSTISHGISVAVSETDGKLDIRIKNGRSERISIPRETLALYLVDDVPTLDLGPDERYYRTCSDLRCDQTAKGIEPGGEWRFQYIVPHGEEAGPDAAPWYDPHKARDSTPTEHKVARLRVWIFPQVGLFDDCPGRLPLLSITSASPSAEPLQSDHMRKTFRSFTQTDERGVFEQVGSPKVESKP